MKKRFVCLVFSSLFIISGCSFSNGKVSKVSDTSFSSKESITSKESIESSIEEISSSSSSDISIETSEELSSSESSIDVISSEELSESIESETSSFEEFTDETSIDTSSEESSSIESSSIESLSIESSSIESSSVQPEKPALVNSEEYLELFDHSSSISMSLKFSNASLQALSKYGAGYGSIKYQDLYFPADFSITLNDKEYSFDEVGVRMKGNTSRAVIVDEYNNLINLCHFKISFKATFDDEIYNDNEELQAFYKVWDNKDDRSERKDRNLFGLEKLDLKYVPRNGENCLASELYAFDCFRDAGLIAPRANLCLLSLANDVNSFSYGYELIEPIDKQMIKRYYSKAEAKGDLYKCVYKSWGKADLTRRDAVEYLTDSNGHNVGARVPNGKIGVEDKYNEYVPAYQLKTNDKEGENSDFSSLTNLINAVWSCGYAGAPLSKLEEVLDIDKFLQFSAVSYILGNFDDQRYNFNNYYLYFVPSTKKAIYIPYDWDWCMGDFIGFNLSNSTPFSETTLDGSGPSTIFYDTFLKGNGGRNISYSREAMQDAYFNYVSEYAPSYLDISRFSALLSELNISRMEESRVRYYMEAKLEAAKIKN